MITAEAASLSWNGPVAVDKPSAPNPSSVQSQILSSLSHRLTLPDTIESLRAKYQNAKPFPHLVIDNLFPHDMLNAVLREIPPITDKYFVRHEDEHQNKFGLRSAVNLGRRGAEFTSFLHSAAFLVLLSEITGISGLLPDPYLQGGGYHVVPRGGQFAVHLDRQTDYITGLRRRLAFITYLNHDWKPEYGGDLELWNETGTQREVSISPVFNRVAMFEVTGKSYHGHPAAIQCPQDESRKSFMVYYHTVGEGLNIDLRSSVWAPTICRTPQQKLRKLAKDLTPPLISRYVRERRIERAEGKTAAVGV